MTREKLVAQIANQAGIKKDEAEKFLTANWNLIIEKLKMGDKVTLPGIGTFTTATRRGFIAQHPKTRQKFEIPARVLPVFHPSLSLKKEINR